MGKHRAAVVLAAVVAASACGCTAQQAADPSRTPAPTINWTAKLAAFTAKYGEYPPSDPPYTDAQATEVTALYSDKRWVQLLLQYPTAARPTDSFVHWAGNGDPDIAACLIGAGATPNTGTTVDGTATVGYSGPATMEYAVASFDCEFVRYPVRQSPWQNRAQLSYYYDYMTHYLVACYQAHGAKVDPGMPTRDEFISQNPSDFSGTRWQLTPPNAADAPDPTYDGTDAVCSATGPGGATQ